MSALMLHTVFEQTKRKYQLQLLAGEAGLYRSLRWLYFSEDIENATFIRGGELMVLTGFSLGASERLEQFIDMLIARRACGVIINVGKYIQESDLTPHLRRRCDEANFPLIIMPWKFHLTDIIQEYSRHIFFKTQELNRLHYVMQLLLGDPKAMSEEASTRLLANGFDPQGKFTVGMVSYSDTGTATGDELQIEAENALNQVELPLCVFPYRQHIIVLCHGTEEDAFSILMQIDKVYRQQHPKTHFVTALGSCVAGVAGLKESYARACFALDVAQAQEKMQMRFADTGIFQLFHSCQDTSILAQLTQILAPIVDYDKQYGGQLMTTLQTYLDLQGSVQLVSDALYCHRNTTNYRMKKIQTLLSCNLDETEVIFQLQMAFHVKRYLTIISDRLRHKNQT